MWEDITFESAIAMRRNSHLSLNLSDAVSLLKNQIGLKIFGTHMSISEKMKEIIEW